MGIAFSIFWVLVGLGYAGVKIGKEARDSSRSNALAGLGLFGVMMGGIIVIMFVGYCISDVGNETVRNILLVIYGIAVLAVIAYFIIEPEIEMARYHNRNPVSIKLGHPELWEEVKNMPIPSDNVLKNFEPQVDKRYAKSAEEMRRLAIVRWRERKLEDIYYDRYVKDSGKM